MFRRHAVYFAPEPGTPLARLGAAWLGRDAEAGGAAPPPVDLPPGCRPLAELTATPRRYGLHGTLKPPMRLAEGRSAEAFLAAVAALAGRLAPVDLGRLQPARLGRFLALVPAAQPAALDALAARVVRELDPFRAPPLPEEFGRRRAAGLAARQEALLRRWGYPYVMEEFRFHLTLTGPLAPHEAAPVAAAATAHFAPALAEPARVADLAVFGEDAAGVFHAIDRFPLTG